VSPSLFGAIVIVAVIVIVIVVWLLTRDTTANPPKPPGRHRRPGRDMHDPIRRDDEQPPGQNDADGDDAAGGAKW
jgi:hypothetical protein